MSTIKVLPISVIKSTRLTEQTASTVYAFHSVVSIALLITSVLFIM